MISSAKAQHIRMSARKMRLVLELVRGKFTKNALTILDNTPKRAAGVVNKLIRSAVANAKNKGIDEEGLYVSRICADEGVRWKRFRAGSFGRGSRILKRTCHVSVELDKKAVAPAVVEAQKKKIVQKKEKVVKKKT